MGGANIQIDPQSPPLTQRYHAFTMEDARKLLVKSCGREMAVINIISLLSDLDPDLAKDILFEALRAYTLSNAQGTPTPTQVAIDKFGWNKKEPTLHEKTMETIRWVDQRDEERGGRNFIALETPHQSAHRADEEDD